MQELAHLHLKIARHAGRRTIGLKRARSLHTEITGEMASELLNTIGGGIVGFKRDPHRG